jgi:hypothetical protein
MGEINKDGWEGRNGKSTRLYKFQGNKNMRLELD